MPLTGRRRFVPLFALGLLGLISTPAASAQSTATADNYPSSLFSTDYLDSLWRDTGAVLTQPARWDGADWRDASLWAGGTLVAASLDRTIRQQAQTYYRTRGERRFFKQWEKLGAEYSFVEIAAFEVWGITADNVKARETAMDAVTATVIASGIITPVLKYSIGRYRPSQTTSAFKFRPFSGHQSLPSGHATQAFAIATVVATHFNEPWEQALSYGAAALVDVARIQQNAHFASDVVVGSAIGWAVGRAVVHRHHPAQAFSFDIEPWFSGDAQGLAFSKQF